MQSIGPDALERHATVQFLLARDQHLAQAALGMEPGIDQAAHRRETSGSRRNPMEIVGIGRLQPGLFIRPLDLGGRKLFARAQGRDPAAKLVGELGYIACQHLGSERVAQLA